MGIHPTAIRPSKPPLVSPGFWPQRPFSAEPQAISPKARANHAKTGLSANAYVFFTFCLIGHALLRTHDGAFNQWAYGRLQPGTFMTDIPQDLSWPLRPNSRFDLPRRRPLPWWRRSSAPQWLPLMMEVVAALVALSVLLAFYQVVNASVERGVLQREAIAARALATHHCNTLSALGAGEMCLARLNSPADSTPLRLKQQ